LAPRFAPAASARRRRQKYGIVVEADLEQAVVAFDDNVGASRRLGRLCRALPARAREADAMRISVMA
jgi:hypothetical protein